jgi:hypothetical protein
MTITVAQLQEMFWMTDVRVCEWWRGEVVEYMTTYFPCLGNPGVLGLNFFNLKHTYHATFREDF